MALESLSLFKPDSAMSEIFHAFIVDDDLAAIAALNQEIDLFVSNLTVIGSAQEIETAIQEIERLKPDILLLDIQLKGGSGFDILKNVAWSDFHIIFTTAYHEYAIEAIKAGAADYLLKPVRGEELETAINKIAGSKRSYYANTPANEPEKIVLTSLGEIHLFDPSDIVWCHANGNYTQFHLADGKRVMVSKTMKEIEDSLEQDIFIRVHKSYIVNFQFIKRFLTRDHLIILKDGTEIPVSQRRKANVTKRLRGGY